VYQQEPLRACRTKTQERTPGAVADEENVAVVVEARSYPRARQRVCNKQFQTQSVAFAHDHRADIEVAFSDSVLELREVYATLCDQAPPAPPLLIASPTKNASSAMPSTATAIYSLKEDRRHRSPVRPQSMLQENLEVCLWKEG
jgi:hypothetical protein